MTTPLNPTPSPKPGRGRLLAVLVLLLVALAGGLAGVALDRTILRHGFRGHGWHGPGGEGRGGGHRDRFRERFARELGLSADQQKRIDSIMERQGRQLRAVRSTVQPQLDSIVARTRRQLDSVLTPEQRTKAEALRKRHHRTPGGPPGRPPEGPPPEGPSR